MCNPTLVAGVAVSIPNVQHYQLSSGKHVEFAICGHINSESACSLARNSVPSKILLLLLVFFILPIVANSLYFKPHFRNSSRSEIIICAIQFIIFDIFSYFENGKLGL
jgi:uncharacterized membrane protein